jgi:glycerate 2-kinase
VIQNGATALDRTARRLCLQSFEEALRAVDPYRSTLATLKVKHDQLVAGDYSAPLSRFSKIVVVAVGKASILMMSAAIEVLGEHQLRGIIVTPRGEGRPIHDPRIRVIRAAHPIPDVGGLKAARLVLKTVQAMKDNELLVCLISGGASAMLPSPPRGIGLKEEKQLTQHLLNSKATIHEINTVRRHISTLKGGRLVEQCKASSILSLIVSDVPGNNLTDIASGLTVEDPTTYQDAVDVLRTHDIWVKTPGGIRDYLCRALDGHIPETPKPGAQSFSRVRNIIIADSMSACTAAKRALKADSADAKILTSSAEMEAKQMGRLLASLATGRRKDARPRGSQAIVMGGETTVEVKGKGKGGRNQETVLWAVEGIARLDGTVVAALGTDGIDGNSTAAGALADGRTADRARRRHLKVSNFLARNDSYRFFRSLNDSLISGRTGTNVGDLYLMVSLR